LIAVLLFKRNIMTTIDLAKNNFQELFMNNKAMNANESFTPNIVTQRVPVERKEHFSAQPADIPKAGPRLVVTPEQANVHVPAMPPQPQPAPFLTPPMLPKLM